MYLMLGGGGRHLKKFLPVIRLYMFMHTVKHRHYFRNSQPVKFKVKKSKTKCLHVDIRSDGLLLDRLSLNSVLEAVVAASSSTTTTTTTNGTQIQTGSCTY